MILPLLSIGLFILGQAGRISLNLQEINIYLYEVPYFLWIVYSLATLREKFKLSRSAKILLAVLTTTFLWGIGTVTPYQNAVSALYLLRLTFYIVGFNLVISYISKERVGPIYIKTFLLLIGVVGVVQYFFYSNLRNLQYQGWDPHLSRVFGQFLDTSVAAAVYGLILIYLVFNQKLFPKVINIVISAIYVFLGFFTYSRGFMVSILTTAVGYTVFAKRNLKVVLITTLLLAGFALLSPRPFGEGVNLLRTSTIESRAEDYTKGFELWQKKPILGIGYNRIRYFKVSESLNSTDMNHSGASFHSSFLIILVTAGVVGLVAFAYWLLTLIKISNFTLISGVFLGTYSLFDNILLHPFILFLWPVLIGLTSRKKQ